MRSAYMPTMRFLLVDHNRVCVGGRCIHVSLAQGTFDFKKKKNQVNNCANALTLQHVNRCSVQTVRAYAAGRWRTALLRNQPNARTHAAFNPGTALTQKKKTLVPLKNCLQVLS